MNIWELKAENNELFEGNKGSTLSEVSKLAKEIINRNHSLADLSSKYMQLWEEHKGLVAENDRLAKTLHNHKLVVALYEKDEDDLYEKYNKKLNDVKVYLIDRIDAFLKRELVEKGKVLKEPMTPEEVYEKATEQKPKKETCIADRINAYLERVINEEEK